LQAGKKVFLDVMIPPFSASLPQANQVGKGRFHDVFFLAPLPKKTERDAAQSLVRQQAGLS
jgi:hypothetical protein